MNNAVYIDLHIHTTETPGDFSAPYNLEALIKGVTKIADGKKFLISFTDHNAINKNVYLEAKKKVENIIIGVELHVRYDKERKPFHCHIFFNINEIDADVINTINKLLDDLYPKKQVSREDDVPFLNDIVNKFSDFDFMLLPHAGQGHSTFNDSIPHEAKLDNIIEQSVYYNFFDGFTSRSNIGLEETYKYFSTLGIKEFISLITCSDNYNPEIYPEPKSKEANGFIPTWMFAQPNFSGLQLSLSESSRFRYSDKKPEDWSIFIKSAQLHNSKIDIDVKLTPGLNVVIGGSSSGKTLFVDSLYKKITSSPNSDYESDYNVSGIIVDNSGGVEPHFIEQNFISSVVSDKDHRHSIEEIDIIKKIFPGDKASRLIVEKNLTDFKNDLNSLIDSVKLIESSRKELVTIQNLNDLIILNQAKENIIKKILPSEESVENIEITDYQYQQFNNDIDNLETVLSRNPFINHDSSLSVKLKEELSIAYNDYKLELSVREIIRQKSDELDDILLEEGKESQVKSLEFNKLLFNLRQYYKNYINFYKILKKISTYNFKCPSEEKVLAGHRLSIENSFTLDPDKFLEVINSFIKSDSKIKIFGEITPEKLFEVHFKDKPRINNYEDFKREVFSSFQKINKAKYNIISKDGRDYYKLSAGWKTAIILDLILGYEDDYAPLIIDQPEDNLASSYINHGLITSIKKLKPKKQIIIVSHNATIPMIGDAQNIILCENDGEKITIKSNCLEGVINGKRVVDHIADITDGGKVAIKKRVKKYNIKQYK
jgi:hypothetical protein